MALARAIRQRTAIIQIMTKRNAKALMRRTRTMSSDIVFGDDCTWWSDRHQRTEKYVTGMFT